MGGPAADRPAHCPSARPESPEGVVFGVVGGTAGAPRVGYLTELLPVVPSVLALAGPAAPGEVFRIGAPCATSGCLHFDGGRCRLAARIVEGLPEVVSGLPPCRLRPTCLWWRQEGPAACHRCPQVVSQVERPSEDLRRAADPASPAP
jgi:hypothetical protein